MVINRVVTIKEIVFGIISTQICRIKARVFGVKLGQGVYFVGYATFRKSSRAKLVIGNNCTFRSASISNLIGINRPCIIGSYNSGQLEIGNNCGFSGTVIGCFESVMIKDNVRCGANTLITDSDWHSKDVRSGKNKPVLLERNVWLGEGVKVLKGVTIGENTVIGAGSIVTRDIPANVIAAGNPCKVIKKL